MILWPKDDFMAHVLDNFNSDRQHELFVDTLIGGINFEETAWLSEIEDIVQEYN